MLNEIWKPITGYEGIYEVSDKGRVRSLDRIDPLGRELKGKVLKQTPWGNGYLTVSLWNTKRKTRVVHHLVCEAFIGPRPDGKEVCHGPNGKLDNSVANLSYGTHSENMYDKIRDGSGTNRPVVRGDGKEFTSALEAARVCGYHQGNITMCCLGNYKSSSGHTWRYKHAQD